MLDDKDEFYKPTTISPDELSLLNHDKPEAPDLFTMLTVLFVILKLLGAIEWSWLWVLFPTILQISAISMLMIGTVCGVLVENARR